MFARRHVDFLAEPFDISNRPVDAVFGVNATGPGIGG
jgi:hypothetical protein